VHETKLLPDATDVFASIGHAAGGDARRGSALAATLDRQAALDPARSGAASRHSFADTLHLRETLRDEDALHLAAAVAAAADDGNCGVAVAADTLEDGLHESVDAVRIVDIDTCGAACDAGFSPLAWRAHVDKRQLAGARARLGFLRCDFGWCRSRERAWTQKRGKNEESAAEAAQR
jgi:hypothetical protein